MSFQPHRMPALDEQPWVLVTPMVASSVRFNFRGRVARAFAVKSGIFRHERFRPAPPTNEAKRIRYRMSWEIRQGDALECLSEMDDESVNCCVTSPPYWGLRDYGAGGQIGLENTPDEYVAKLVDVFGEVKRVLRDDGTLWLNLGDSYATGGRGGGMTGPSGEKQRSNKGALLGPKSIPPPGLKQKDLVGIPWRVAFALQADGWYLRSDIIWSKPNPMPESVTDRPTKAHEYLFLLSKSARYYYDADAIAEPLTSDPKRWGRHTKKDPGAQAVHPRPMFSADRDGTNWGNGETRNRRSVWTVSTQPYTGAHFATYPPSLVDPCVLAGCPEGGTVLDPFSGAGTTGVVALRHGRNYVGIEINPDYIEMSERRISDDAPLLNAARSQED